MQRDSLRRMGGRARGQEQGTGQRGESDGWKAHGRSQMQGAMCTLLQADTGQHGGAYSVPGSGGIVFVLCLSLASDSEKFSPILRERAIPIEFWNK